MVNLLLSIYSQGRLAFCESDYLCTSNKRNGWMRFDDAGFCLTTTTRTRMNHGCAHHLTLELASVTLVFEVLQKLKIRLTNPLMAYALILPMTYVRRTVYGRW